MQAPSIAERRQISVLYCDLVGSTYISTRFDPEDASEFIINFLEVCKDCVAQSGGFTARFTGDGILAYFGYPSVSENDAERALHAAILIRDAVAKLSLNEDYSPAVRIGVATGLTIVGGLVGAGSAAEEHLVVGGAPNLAARLQASAKPHQILVSDHTRSLAFGVFAFRGLGKRRFKGFAEPQRLWELAGPRPTTIRFGARRGPATIPMAGRDTELDQLIQCWGHCLDGRGALVEIIGEPGIGKSRLLHEFRRHVATAPHIWLEGGGAQVFQNTPFRGVVQMVRAADARPPGRRDRPNSPGAASLSEATDRRLREFSAAADRAPADLSGMNMARRRRELLGGLVDWIGQNAVRAPTVVAIEDAHWMDPSTLEFVGAVASLSRPVLVVCTSREDIPAGWASGGFAIRISLRSLDVAATRRVVSSTAPDLPDETVRLLITRSGGVPLFAEELARLVADRGGLATSREIPESLSDLLLSRLDQVGPARRLAQIASVLGGEFRIDLLGVVAEHEMPAWPAALAELAAKKIVDDGQGGVCRFRHALIRDAAYGSLLRGPQAALHRRAAVAITERFPDVAGAGPELLAQHWEAANEHERAVAAWREAGRVGGVRQAYAEAQRAYERAIAALAHLHGSATGIDLELQLQAELARTLQITQGYSAPATVAATLRARHLAEQAGDLPDRLQNTLTAWVGMSSSGDYDEGLRLADQLLALAQATAREEWLGAAYMAQITTRYRLGDLEGAEDAFQAGQDSFQRPEFKALPGALAQTYGNAGIIAWILGDGAEACRRVEVMLDESARSSRLFDIAFANFMAATQAVLMGRPGEAVRHATRAIEISDQNFPQFSSGSRVVLGCALCREGRPSDGLVSLSEGLKLMRQAKVAAGLTMYLAWLGEAQLQVGDESAAAATLAEALRINPRERFYRPEALRLQADLYSRRGQQRAAKVALAEARALSRDMHARAFLKRPARSAAAPA